MTGRAVAAAILLAAPAALAGGVRDLADAWLVSAPRSAVVLAAASGDAAVPEQWLELRQGRLYGLAELPQVGMVVGANRGPWQLDVSWERLGAVLFREETTRVRLSHGGACRTGLSVTRASLSLAGESTARWMSVAPSLSVPLLRGVTLSVAWPVTDQPSWFGRRGLRRWVVAEGGGSTTAWTAALDRRADGTPVLQLEALARLVTGLAVGGRWDAASGSVGVCTAWRRGGLVLRSGHLAHPDLGLSHRWSLGVIW